MPTWMHPLRICKNAKYKHTDQPAEKRATPNRIHVFLLLKLPSLGTTDFQK
jgi:hypothetical protein